MAKSKKRAAKRPTKRQVRKPASDESGQTVTSYLIVKDAVAAIAFYKAAFGARLLYRLAGPDGRIGHAEMQIGSTRLMMADENPGHGALSPTSIGGSPVTFHLAVKSADRAVDKAIKAGAALTRPVADQFYGQRTGMVTDPFGHGWFLSATVEKLTPREIDRRFKKLVSGA
jgi:PhnB protein